ncbi:unnamed protein product [Urochloa decumbens]|uniref:Myb-like domain-containing protein n=1 Tax=Urochloa decumbens TaxID=240449 RepID=A0ABC8YG58_9POAL
MAQKEDDDLEIQLLMTGPANEANLDEILGGTFSNDTLLRNVLLTNTDAVESRVEKIVTDHQHEMEDYLELSMRDCFLAPWRCGQRGTRLRGRSWGVEARQLFGSQYSCTSGDRTRRSRKNNARWTEDEMVKLVHSVSKKGIGKWGKMKDDYFSASIRTAVHLKDKWRNLVRACKAKNTTKKKVKVQKATEFVVRRFRHRILAIEAKHILVTKKT